jgi:hypothetical protein
MRREALEEERRRRILDRIGEELLDVKSSALHAVLEDPSDPAAVDFAMTLRAVRVETGATGVQLGYVPSFAEPRSATDVVRMCHERPPVARAVHDAAIALHADAVDAARAPLVHPHAFSGGVRPGPPARGGAITNVRGGASSSLDGSAGPHSAVVVGFSPAD